MNKRSKTRNPRKREAISNIILTVLMIVLCVVLTVWTLDVWAEHPGEQFADSREYTASLQE